MNKIKTIPTILCAGLLLSTIQVNAQHFMAGLSFGPLVSDVRGSDTRDDDNDFYKVGISGGVFVNRSFGDKNTLQLEINYVQKGTEQLPDSTNNGYFKLTLNYVEVPLVLRHRVHVNVNKTFYNNFEWELGLSAGYLFSYNYNNNGYNWPLSSSGLNDVDISILAGINYLISPSFYFGVRYSNAIMPVIKHGALPADVATSYLLSFNNGSNMLYQFTLKYIIAGKQMQ